ncbi:hypothetical protein H0H87_008896 [Tephrocybe sp. NHM501043]|nr:hypothetical protein H0H87_008896 [Tephrocybe sp. NHM501043]
MTEPVYLSTAFATKLMVEQAHIEDIIDDDINIEQFTAWFLQSQIRSVTTPNFRPTRTQILFTTPNASFYHGVRFIARDEWQLDAKPQSLNRPPLSRRLVVHIINRNLNTFTSSRHLMEAMHHAYIAHSEACTRCGNWLHRDISPRNILLDREGKGVLIDYDHRKVHENTEKGSAAPSE